MSCLARYDDDDDCDNFDGDDDAGFGDDVGDGNDDNGNDDGVGNDDDGDDDDNIFNSKLFWPSLQLIGCLPCTDQTLLMHLNDQILIARAAWKRGLYTV